MTGTEGPATVVEISARVFLLAVLTTLLVALALGAGLGFLAFFAMRDASAVREALEQAKARAINCEVRAIRSEAKLEQVHELFDVVGGRKRATGMGGGG